MPIPIESSLNSSLVINQAITEKHEARARAFILPSELVSSIQEVCQEALSYLTSSMIYAGFQDPAIGKIVGGSILTVTGSYYMVKSRVPQHMWRVLTQSREQNEETRPCKSLALFSLAALATIGGACSIVSGLTDLMTMESRQPKEPFLVPQSIYPSGSDDFISSAECHQEGEGIDVGKESEACLAAAAVPTPDASLYPIECQNLAAMNGNETAIQSVPTLYASHVLYPSLECQKGETPVTVQQALNMVLKCPYSVEVLEGIRLRGEGRFDVKELSDEMAAHIHANFYGQWVGGQDRKIFVRKSLCKHKLSILFFEILNAAQEKQTQQLIDQCKEGKVSREMYAEKSEKIEFNNRRMHHIIAGKCIKAGKWDREIDIFAGIFEKYQSFATWWKAIKDSPHANLFRKDWDERYKKIYCEKNPSADECDPDNQPQYVLSSIYTFKDEL
jgi:hypothetical protein